jgi:hypothetical protein
VRTGRNAFEELHSDELFAYLEQHPEGGRAFDAAMIENTARDGITVADSYDFSGNGTVIDVDGGQGLLIASELRANAAVKESFHSCIRPACGSQWLRCQTLRPPTPNVGLGCVETPAAAARVE